MLGFDPLPREPGIGRSDREGFGTLSRCVRALTALSFSAWWRQAAQWRRAGMLAAAVLVAALCQGCGSDGGRLEQDLGQLHADANAVADGAEDLAFRVETREVLECRNDGSGPISPQLQIRLHLRAEADPDDLRRQVSRGLRARGFAEIPDETAMLVGQRDLFDGRVGSIALRRSRDAQDAEVGFLVSTWMEPTIEC